jgi:hypothetical protein
VIKGATTSGTPTRPSYTKGNVLEGVEVAEMPLYAVQLSGVNVASITPLFTIATGFDDVYRKNEVYTKEEVEAIKQTLQTSISTTNNAVSNVDTRVSTGKNNDGHTRNAFEDAYDAFSSIYSMLVSIKAGGTIADVHMTNLDKAIKNMYSDSSSINRNY